MTRTIFPALTLAILALANPLRAADAGHHDHHHHVAVAGGGAFKGEKPKSAWFLGLEYEYRFNPSIGLGAYYEETLGDFDLQAFGVMFLVHPTKGLKLGVGAAVERKFGDRKNKALIRLQVAYDFHVGQITLGPMAAWDLIEDQTNVAYVGFGLGFRVLNPSRSGSARVFLAGGENDENADAGPAPGRDHRVWWSRPGGRAARSDKRGSARPGSC